MSTRFYLVNVNTFVILLMAMWDSTDNECMHQPGGQLPQLANRFGGLPFGFGASTREVGMGRWNGETVQTDQV